GRHTRGLSDWSSAVCSSDLTRLLAAKGRISIEGTALVTGRRGPNGRAGEANAGAAAAGSSRTASSSALGARLLDAKRRAGPPATDRKSVVEGRWGDVGAAGL